MLTLTDGTVFNTFNAADAYLLSNPTSILSQRFYELRMLIGDTTKCLLPQTNWNEDLTILDQAKVLYPTQTAEVLDYFQHRYDILKG